MLGKKIKFKIPRVPGKNFIKDKFVILEPVNPLKHSKDLIDTFSLDKKGLLWKYMPDGPFKNLNQLNYYLKNTDCFFYTIYSKRHKKYCGLASYLRIQPKSGSIEVGYITYSLFLRKTVEATETMYLMMKNVFETLKYRRYEWKCNNGNKKSKNDDLRLGFKFEGVFRQAAVVKGRNRDTTWFSVIDKEWKKIKKGYLRYFSKKNLDENFNQKRSLKFS
jgi:RimJ/RimL family protein N-acetyltransferase